MKKNGRIIQEAIEVLKIEAQGLMNLVDRIDGQFVKMVDYIYLCSGRVVVAGIGKSGIIGRKIVATLNSSGTPSIFLQPVESVMTPNPKRIHLDSQAYDALNLMEKNEITVLPIIDSSGFVCGILHLHDILGKGEFRFDSDKRGDSRDI